MLRIDILILHRGHEFYDIQHVKHIRVYDSIFGTISYVI